MSTVTVSPFLKKFCKNNEQFVADIATLKELKDFLYSTYPDLLKVILDKDGRLISFANIFFDGERINFDGPDLVISSTASIHINVSISGG